MAERKLSGWSEDVEKYSRQIWLAGLGAYAKIGEDGSKLFESLVREGERAEQMVRDEVESVKNGARSRVADVKDKALGKWNALEEAFDKRLTNAITRLGVPSRSEILALDEKIEALNQQLDRLSTLRLVSDEPDALHAATKAKRAKAESDTPRKPKARKFKAETESKADEAVQAASDAE